MCSTSKSAIQVNKVGLMPTTQYTLTYQKYDLLSNWPIPLLCSLSMSVPWMKNLFTFSVLIWKGSIDMVRNRNFEALHQSRGVKAVAVVLETNIKGIISGNGVALIQENFLVLISSKRLLAKKQKWLPVFTLWWKASTKNYCLW